MYGANYKQVSIDACNKLLRGELSAVDEVRQTYGIPVISIATLDDLVAWLSGDPASTPHVEAVRRYRERYGVRGKEYV